MLIEDRELLEQMVSEYPVQDVVDTLHQIMSKRADELSDQLLIDRAKEASMIAWHLRSLSVSDEDISID